ncbi:unnamed protein product, partial [Amoebophrya sp. A25]
QPAEQPAVPAPTPTVTAAQILAQVAKEQYENATPALLRNEIRLDFNRAPPKGA